MKYGMLLFGMIWLFSCSQPKDKDLILGKWQSDQDWFEYKENMKYSAGKMMMTMVQDYTYAIDEKAKELTMYTNEANQTYYLIYRFIGKDTLAVRNRLNTDTTMVRFVRVN